MYRIAALLVGLALGAIVETVDLDRRVEGEALAVSTPALAGDIGEEGDFGGTYSYIGPGVSSEPEPEVLVVPGYAPDAYAEPDAYDAPDVAVAPLLS